MKKWLSILLIAMLLLAAPMALAAEKQVAMALPRDSRPLFYIEADNSWIVASEDADHYYIGKAKDGEYIWKNQLTIEGKKISYRHSTVLTDQALIGVTMYEMEDEKTVMATYDQDGKLVFESVLASVPAQYATCKAGVAVKNVVDGVLDKTIFYNWQGEKLFEIDDLTASVSNCLSDDKHVFISGYDKESKCMYVSSFTLDGKQEWKYTMTNSLYYMPNYLNILADGAIAITGMWTDSNYSDFMIVISPEGELRYARLSESRLAHSSIDAALSMGDSTVFAGTTLNVSYGPVTDIPFVDRVFEKLKIPQKKTYRGIFVYTVDTYGNLTDEQFYAMDKAPDTTAIRSVIAVNDELYVWGNYTLDAGKSYIIKLDDLVKVPNMGYTFQTVR